MSKHLPNKLGKPATPELLVGTLIAAMQFNNGRGGLAKDILQHLRETNEWARKRVYGLDWRDVKASIFDELVKRGLLDCNDGLYKATATVSNHLLLLFPSLST